MKTHDMDYQQGKSQRKQDDTGKGVGVSGQNPGKEEGPQPNRHGPNAEAADRPPTGKTADIGKNQPKP